MLKVAALTLFLLLGVFISHVRPQTGYGDPLPAYPNHPSWQERAIHVLTNACRLDPVGYRDLYVGNYNILLPQNYPPAGPLYWYIHLNRVARAHAIDIANDCGLSHSSCDGTSFSDRVYSYYTKSYSIAENIATGRSAPQNTMRQWIMDGDPPAADKTSGDGHRKNIMNSRYHELGVGYAYGPVKYNHFWVQDFGGGQNDYNDYPVVDGVHLFLEQDKTTFMANYYNSAGQAPKQALVHVAGSSHALSFHLGEPGQGTYSTALASADSCRPYYFSFTDGQDRNWRYPEEGYLVTFGEGGCTKSYAPAESIYVEATRPLVKDLGKPAVFIKKEGNGFSIRFVSTIHPPLFTRLMDINGRILKERFWNCRNSGSGEYGKQYRLRMEMERPVAAGLYLFVHYLSNGQLFVSKAVLLP